MIKTNKKIFILSLVFINVLALFTFSFFTPKNIDKVNASSFGNSAKYSTFVDADKVFFPQFDNLLNDSTSSINGVSFNSRFQNDGIYNTNSYLSELLNDLVDGKTITISMTFPAAFLPSDNFYYFNLDNLNSYQTSLNATTMPFGFLFSDGGSSVGFSASSLNASFIEYKLLNLGKSYTYNGQTRYDYITTYVDFVFSDLFESVQNDIIRYSNFNYDEYYTRSLVNSVTFLSSDINYYNNDYIEVFYTEKSNVILTPSYYGYVGQVELENSFNNGYDKGYSAGLDIGYNNGYNVGLGESSKGVKGLLVLPASIIGTLFRTIFNWLNFTIFGINVWSMLLIIGGVGVFILFLKMFLGR